MLEKCFPKSQPRRRLAWTLALPWKGGVLMPQTVGEIERAAQTLATLRRIADALDAIHGTLAALLDTVKGAAGEPADPACEERW